MAAFVGRTAQLRLLDELWDSGKALLLILYGRRRVGKTRLITQWIESRERRSLYWVAVSTSALDQLRSFSQAVYGFARPLAPAPADFTYADWPQAWQEVARLAETERLALFVDEFTYLLETTPALAGILQNEWDHSLSHSNLLLVLSGSHMGMMERQALAYQAPLYGRASAQLRLLPLPFGTTRAYFPRYGAAERVAIYAIFGGIPAYWERLDQQLSLSENLRQQLLTPNNLMQDEPRLLLQDFLSEPHNYVAILRAIAGGARAQKDISTRTGLAQGHVSKYLSVLREAGYVERRVPLTESETSRQGRHHITDPYLRFYFRFLSPRQAQLALGVQEQALAEIKRHLLDFIGTHTWEELCREWVLRAGARGELPVSPDQVGSIWTQDAQVDVAGINTMEKSLILGECKWTPRAVGIKELERLVEKTSAVLPAHGQWAVVYLGFARSGWTEAARDFTRRMQREMPAGRNWRAVGMDLVDLRRLDSDLERWTAA